MARIWIFFCLLFCGAANAQSRIDALDLKILQQMERERTGTGIALTKTISEVNNYVNIAVPLGLLVAGTIDDNKSMRQNALYVASSAAYTALLNFTIKHIFKRPRPFVAHVSFTPVYRPGGYSMPSGHTSLSFATATALSRAYPKWYVIAPSFLWAGTVGYSRMYLGVHNPSDVAAGALLGTGTAFAWDFLKR